MLNKIDKDKIYGKAIVSDYSITNAGKYLLTERGGRSKLTAFSLAEMMVVMLIMSIVLAAMAPIITTRIKADQALKAGEAAAPQEDNNPWKWVEGSDTDAYSQASRNMIGQTAAEEDDGDAMLILNKGKDDKDDILFKNSNGQFGHLDMRLSQKGIILGDTTADSRKTGGVSIGFSNALGVDNYTSSSIILGYNNSVNNSSSIAIGSYNTTLNYSGVAIGTWNTAGNNAYIFGSNNTTKQSGCSGYIIGGSNTNNSGSYYIFGARNVADGKSGYAVGASNKLNGSNEMALGHENTVNGNYNGDAKCYAFGYKNTAVGNFAMAIGMENEASSNTLAMGMGSKASAIGAVAIGIEYFGRQDNSTTASGSYSTAIGYRSLSSGKYSLALGNYAHATGESSIVICTNDSAVYMPDGNTPLPYSGVAHGKRSVAIGYKAQAANDYDFVLGCDQHNVKIPGTLTVNGTKVTSDKRLKYIKGENKNGLDAIKKMKIYDFTFKKDENKEPRVGVIAQELQKILPDAVKKGSDGFLTIRIDDIIYTLVNAVKELDRKVSELTQTLKQVQAEQKRINQRLDTLEQKSVH